MPTGVYPRKGKKKFFQKTATRAYRSPFQSRDQRITELEAEVKEFREHKHAARFAKELGDAVMTILANKPFKQWPEVAKVAYAHVSRNQEVSAQLYYDRLPKE